MFQTQENGKKLKKPAGSKFEPPNFSKNVAPSLTRYHGQPSSCTISEKTNDSILRKFSDGWTDRQTDRQREKQTDKSDFIGRSLSNVEHPTTKPLNIPSVLFLFAITFINS